MESSGVERLLRSAAVILLTLGIAACGDSDTPAQPDPDPDPEVPEEPPLTLAYVGSEGCGYCHTERYGELRRSGHPYKLNRVVDGQPPVYPFSEVPSPPNGLSWDDISYVIGGFGWKARFIGLDGYIITEGGNNQFNLATGEWVDYHTDEKKPYDCGRCHTTGYQADGHQDGLEGINGQWAEPGIGCEACHGPGSLHARSPTNIPMTVDSRAEA